MKKRLILGLVILCLYSLLPLLLSAQSSTLTPDFVMIPTTDSAPTCAIEERGKMYFNTESHRMFYCNGTEWIEASFSAPFNLFGANASNGNTGLLRVFNNTTGNALFVYTAGGSGINIINKSFAGYFTSGEHGIASLVPSSKTALLTTGKLTFTNIGEGATKVLTSDAEGNATWQSLPAPPAPPATIAFNAVKTTNQTIAHNTETAITFGEVFDEGNVFNTSNSRFEAPQAGVYHFDVSIKWGNANIATNYAEINLYKCNSSGGACVLVGKNKENNISAPNQTFGINAKLAVNEIAIVKVLTTNNNTSRTVEGGSMQTFFSGYLVR